MKAVLAVIAAAALIAGALFVRSDVLDGRGLLEGGVQRPGTPSEAAEEDDGGDAPEESLTVACDAALGDGCPEGSERVDLDDLQAAFAADDAAYDVVVAPSVVIDYIEMSGTSRVRFGTDRPVLATSPLLFAAASGTAQAVADTCAPQTWACLAGLVQDRAITPGITDPRRTTGGLAAFAALTGGFLDDTGYSSNAFGDGAFLTWLDAVQDQAMVHAAPIDALIQFNGARNDSAIVIEAAGLATIGRAAQNQPDPLWPEPLASLAVVAVGVGGVDADAVTTATEAASASLTAAGWRGPDGTPTVDGPPLPNDDDGLPGGGVLFALQDRWN